MKTIKMKSIFRSKLKCQFLMILSLFLFCRCSNDDMENEDALNYNMHANINGAARSFNASLWPDFNGSIRIIGLYDERGIGISQIPDSIGTYGFENSEVNTSYFFRRSIFNGKY